MMPEILTLNSITLISAMSCLPTIISSLYSGCILSAPLLLISAWMVDSLFRSQLCRQQPGKEKKFTVNCGNIDATQNLSLIHI